MRTHTILMLGSLRKNQKAFPKHKTTANAEPRPGSKEPYEQSLLLVIFPKCHNIPWPQFTFYKARIRPTRVTGRIN